jgi:hypothetical protein
MVNTIVKLGNARGISVDSALLELAGPGDGNQRNACLGIIYFGRGII